MLANLAHFANSAHLSLVLAVVLGPIKCTSLKRRSAVDGRVAGGADLKLGKLVKLNVDGIVGVALACCLGLLGL